MDKYFSRRSIERFEPFLRSIVQKLCNRIQEKGEAGLPVDFSAAYRSLASDAVSEFSFPRSFDFVGSPDFAKDFHDTLRELGGLAIWHRHLGFVLQLFTAMPRWLAGLANPRALAVIDYQQGVASQVKEVINSEGQGLDQKTNPTLIREIYDSDLPPWEKTHARLTQEAQVLVGAGTETTGNTMSVLTFRILDDPKIAQRLQKDLREAQPDRSKTMTLLELERVTYLAAVISEGLRWISPLSGRLPRVNPRAPTTYGDYVIPPGTVISMHSKFIHDNESIFSDASSFKPERWLGPDRRHLEHYLVPFSRGPRACVGINLAMAELYLALGNIFHRFDLELYQTSEVDVTMAYDYFSPYPKKESKGIFALVK
jgi:cytochrome P450